MRDVPHIHNEYARTEVSPGFGFSGIPEQVRDASMKDGFSFNVLVIGRRGLGTTTLVNSLFSSTLIQRERPDTITTSTNEIIESNIKLTISVTTYHGDDFSKVLKLISSSNDEYFEKEQGLNIPFEDKRIHAALYIVPGDKMSSNEIEGLKALSSRVNLIPIVTKADMFTVEELQNHRLNVNSIFTENEIQFYDYSEADSARFPMATIASETEYEEDGVAILGRRYPWGFIDIENETYSDFKKLQRVLISECFEDLIYKTDTQFYNQHRKEIMDSESSTISKARISNLLSQMEEVLDQKFEKQLSELKKKEEALSVRDQMNLKNDEASCA